MTPIFTIQRKHDLYHIIDIAVDALTPDDPLNPAYLYLRGRPAAWLYLALAGHNYGALPCTSSPMLARMAPKFKKGHWVSLGEYLQAIGEPPVKEDAPYRAFELSVLRHTVLSDNDRWQCCSPLWKRCRQD
jgi:hypothetical protein